MGGICTEQQLAEWMNQYGNLVYSVCMKFTGDAVTSEDLTQETFLAAYRTADHFTGGSEKAWLCRIAANKSVDYLRRRKHECVEPDLTFQEKTAPMQEEPVQQLLEQEAVMLLQRCIDGLPVRYREAATLYYEKGFTAREISEKTGQNLKTVQTHILRARQKMRQTYGKEMQENGYPSLSG